MQIYIFNKGSQERLLRTLLGINSLFDRWSLSPDDRSRRLRSGPLYVTRSGDWLSLQICREATRLDLTRRIPRSPIWGIITMNLFRVLKGHIRKKCHSKHENSSPGSCSVLEPPYQDPSSNPINLFSSILSGRGTLVSDVLIAPRPNPAISLIL